MNSNKYEEWSRARAEGATVRIHISEYDDMLRLVGKCAVTHEAKLLEPDELADAQDEAATYLRLWMDEVNKE